MYTAPFRAEPRRLPLVWPAGTPLVALVSAEPDAARSRVSVFAAPTLVRRCRLDPGGRTLWTEHRGPGSRPVAAAADPLDELARMFAEHPHDRGVGPVPGWIGWISYDLGRVLEPAAGGKSPPSDARGFPLMEWARVDAAYMHDARTDLWTPVGDPDALPPLAPRGASFTLGEPASGSGPERYGRGVRRVLDLIHAGDAYQANLAHRLEATFSGSARALAAALFDTARPRYGAYFESDDAPRRRALVSASPELFLSLDAATRRVETRPMKGTRPAALAGELDRSDKERAELTMITDLMRNDFGRVCRFGSVRVEREREVELHAGGDVAQGVSTVVGELREGLGVPDLLRATFPPGSVTGAPKIRAMQIIDDLEPFARGPWCGAIGYVADSGDAQFSVAIRTASITGTPAPGALDTFADATLDYPVGAGIVADSSPEAEWDETLAKASILRAIGRATEFDSAKLVPPRSGAVV